jgi:uncharacterized membrane protein (DUF106 family)
MMSFLARIITWINIPINAASRLLLFPIGLMPGWLSNTIVAAVTGVLLLIIFKYTSNQRAIARVRDEIKANMLTLKLFKDSISVILRAQARLFKGALQLLVYSIVPLLVMIVPVSLLLAQLGLWYQSRPLLPGEETVVTMKLNGEINSHWPKVELESMPSAEVIVGAVKIQSKREICWQIRAREKGYQRITFKIDEQRIEKELAIGDGFMRVSSERPGWHWSDILMHPWEKPFGPDSTVQYISIDYPDRLSQTSGANWWLIYFFVASMVFALIFKPFLKVRI